MSLTQRTIESLTEKAEYWWRRAHAAKAAGNDVAHREHLKRYNRRMAAVRYLKGR